MAITMKTASNSSDGFFDHIGLHATTVADISVLKQNGVIFGVDFFTVTAKWTASDGSTVMMTSDALPINTTAVMKSLKHDNGLKPVRVTIGAFVTLVAQKHSALNGVISYPAPNVPSAALPTSSAAEPSKEVVSKAVLNKTVKLANAKYLGQAVFGTSAGSIYRVVGLGPRIRMAIRVLGHKLSVRFEGKLSQSEIEVITSMGFSAGVTSGDTYWSSHFTCTEVPASRVLGSIIYTPTLVFTQCTHPSEVVYGDD
jgi:hypothetical protein